MQTAYKLIRRIWPFVGPVLALLALGRVFDVRINEVVAIVTTILPFVSGAKIGWFVFAVLTAFFTYVELRHRHVPLTAVNTDIEIILESKNGDLATVTRTQKLRANHENVTGFIRTLTSTGTIPKKSIQFNIDHCHASKQKTEFDGTPQKWEVIHRFEPIPRDLLRFGLNTVQRTETLKIHDGFCEAEESYELGIPAVYRHDRISLTVFFHPECGCDFGKCEALWISDNGVVEIPLRHVPPTAGGRAGIQLKIKKPRAGDRYRIKWKNPHSTTKHAATPALVPPSDT